MKGLKFLVSCVAVGAIACTFAAASFATDYTTTATYDATEGTVTIGGGDLASYEALCEGDVTLLILDDDLVSITSEDTDHIVQIQQDDSFVSAVVPVGDLADGTYYVRIGGADVGANNSKGFIETRFTVTSSSEDPETVTKFIGDVNGDEDITGDDASDILGFLAGLVDLEDEDFYAQAYCDGEVIDDLTGDDASAILCFLAGLDCGNVGLSGDFYYDEEEDMYVLSGELYEE